MTQLFCQMQSVVVTYPCLKVQTLYQFTTLEFHFLFTGYLICCRVSIWSLVGIGHGPIELKTINQSNQMPFISKVWFDRDDWTLALSWELQKWWWIDWKIEHSLEPLTGFMLYRTLWKVEHFYCYSLLSFEYNWLASEFKWLLKWPTLYYCHLFHDKSTVTYKSSQFLGQPEHSISCASQWEARRSGGSMTNQVKKISTHLTFSFLLIIVMTVI